MHKQQLQIVQVCATVQISQTNLPLTPLYNFIGRTAKPGKMVIRLIRGHSHVTNGRHYGSGILFYFKLKINYNDLYTMMDFTNTERCFQNL